jgi:hypothetical protein
MSNRLNMIWKRMQQRNPDVADEDPKRLLGVVGDCDSPVCIDAPPAIALSSGVRFHHRLAAPRPIAATANTATSRSCAISRAHTAFSNSSTGSYSVASFTESSSEAEAHSSHLAIRICNTLHGWSCRERPAYAYEGAKHPPSGERG